MRHFDRLGQKKTIIGMVHLGAMPGTPFYEEGSFEETLQTAVANARALCEGGAHGCLVQTVDRVYPTNDQADPARVAGVAAIVRHISDATPPEFQIGVQIMRNALQASTAVAKVCGGSFIRAGALVGATLTADGIVQADPYNYQLYRKRLNALDIKVIAEIDSMHFKWFNGKPTGEVARSAHYAGADAVSVGDPDPEVNERMIRDVKKALPSLPVFLAGYTRHDNAAQRLKEADGAFVGTCLEKGGWGGAIDVQRVREYMDIVNSLQ